MLENVPDIICKISDGRHWIRVKFNQQNQHLFITGCFKEGQIVRVMTSRKDSDENQIVIVSFIEMSNYLYLFVDVDFHHFIKCLMICQDFRLLLHTRKS